MPELPEIHLASRFINRVCSGRFFKGPPVKSDVSKMKPVDWNSDLFIVKASARGKELQVVLTEVENDEAVGKSDGEGVPKTLTLTFGFGMSGKFSFDRFDQIPKHAHFQLFTSETPRNVLSFVDYRRFGTWAARDFDYKRGPDPVLAYDEFRRNVLSHLDKSVFGKAICETIMDQQYFNGIGNYLRAEILYRAKIPPFSKSRSVLENLPLSHELDAANPDLLDLCHIVPNEVFGFAKPGEGYNPDSADSIYIPFKNWLQCYMKPGMKVLIDRQNRTIWFHGPPGALVPQQKKERYARRGKKQEKDESSQDDESVAEGTSEIKTRQRKGAVKKPALKTDDLSEEPVKGEAPEIKTRKRKRSVKTPAESEYFAGSAETSLATRPKRQKKTTVKVEDSGEAPEIPMEYKEKGNRKKKPKSEQSAERAESGRLTEQQISGGTTAKSEQGNADIPLSPVSKRKTAKAKPIKDASTVPLRRSSRLPRAER